MDNQQLVSELHKAGHLSDDRVAAAFEAVQRGLFLPSVPPEQVYVDQPVYTRNDERGGFVGGSDQPSQIADLLTLAALEERLNVLEIGTGTGHSAALISEIVGANGHVTTMEIDRETAEGARDALQRGRHGEVNVVHADGAGGYAQRASYDRIISTVAIWDVPEAWIRQLRPNGLIVTPIFLDGLQVVGAFRLQSNGELYSDAIRSCAFVSILGAAQPPMQHLYMGGGSALRLYSNEVRTIDSARLHLLMSHDAERCHMGAAPSERDYWDGFAPFLMMHVPPAYEFVCYAVEGDKLVYGLAGRGFALITQGGASFVNAQELGDTHCFGGVDAFLEVDRVYGEWEALGSPTIDTMRIRLMPIPADERGERRVPDEGYLYQRQQHQIHVFLVLESDPHHDDNPTPRK
ncbi:MAG: methyltransferase domain-containing protein [Chloroflexota bacterium]